jgi:hypothetical protein
MKHILLGLYLCGSIASAAEQPKVHDCFKVKRLLKIDATFYWADWSNACPFTVDSVYVMVTFVDGANKELGSGVWPMYFVQPGVHRVTRFTVPVGVSTYRTLRVSKITTDSSVALMRDQRAIDAAVHTAAVPGKIPDTGIGPVRHVAATIH